MCEKSQRIEGAKMKLAEALILRSDLQKRIEQIKQRLIRSSKVQENEHPPEDPKDLLDELHDCVTQLETLIQKINRTNSAVTFSGEKKIADALAERDAIALRRRVILEVIDHASVKQDRFSRSEVKFYSTVDITTLQREADQLAKSYRELDIKIQEINWKTDLIES